MADRDRELQEEQEGEETSSEKAPLVAAFVGTSGSVGRVAVHGTSFPDLVPFLLILRQDEKKS